MKVVSGKFSVQLLYRFDKVYLTKATSKVLSLPFTKNTNFEETALDVLVFHHTFQFDNAYISN